MNDNIEVIAQWGPDGTFDFIKNLTILWGPWLGVALFMVWLGWLIKNYIWAKHAGKRPE